MFQHGQTTQLIVGATPENDLKILNLTENLYKKFSLKRVYYSAYVSVNIDKNLPTLSTPPLLRENRLYQADWLLRFYGFQASEILDDTHPNFNEALDPKCDWALRHLENFPVEINKADYLTLLRVPGIGVISAKRIISARRSFNLNFENLKKLGIIMKRAKYFITCNGKYFSNSKFFNYNFINENLIFLEKISTKLPSQYVQTSLFDNENISLSNSQKNLLDNKHSLNNKHLLDNKNFYNEELYNKESLSLPNLEDKIKCLTGAL